MKRINCGTLVFALLILLLAFGLCACGSKQQKAEQPSKTGQGQEEQTTYTFNLNCVLPDTTLEWEPKYVATHGFAKRVEEATNGRVKIKCYFSSQLAPQAQALDALKKNVFQFLSANSAWGGTVPEGDVTYLPFWCKGEEHAIHMLRDTKIGELIDQAYNQQNAHVLFWYAVSSQGIMSKKGKAIKSYADIKGQKVRGGSALWNDWIKKMGAQVINVAAAEQYEALMRGTMDTTIYPYFTLETYKFHEVCKHITVPAFLDPNLCFTAVNKEIWDALPQDLKTIIEKVALECEQESIKGSKRHTESVLANCEKYGVEVIKLSKEEFQKFYDSGLSVWDIYASKTPRCAEIVSLSKKDTAEWVEKRPEAKEWEKRWLAEK